MRILRTAFGLFFLLIISAGQADAIELASSDFFSYTMRSGDGDRAQGIAVDISREIFRRIGEPAEFYEMPFKRCIEYLKAGSPVDGVFLTIKTPERLAAAEFSDELFRVTYQLYYSAGRKRPFEWNSFSDLKAFKIGARAGFSYSPEWTAARAKNGLSVEEVKSDEANVRKLLLGRVDLIILTTAAAKAFDRDPAFASKLKKAGGSMVVGNPPGFIAISKKSKKVKLIPSINRAIADMKNDGMLERILRGH